MVPMVTTERLIEFLLINAAAATVIGLLATWVGRRWGRPALAHTLWVLVLLKLLAPPLFELAALPDPRAWLANAPLAAEVSGPIPDMPLTAVATVDTRAPATAPNWTPGELLAGSLLAIWIAGSLVFAGVAAWRATRFRRLVAGASWAPASLTREARAVAAKIGLRACPALRTIPGRVAPMLHSRVGPCEILVPEVLLDRLSHPEREALLAHELAHVSRRDHWVRYLELAATILYWWHPVVWWARRQLHVVEEASCDAVVLRTLPERSKEYARGLLKTLEVLAGHDARVPSLATGASSTLHLKQRLIMIVQRTAPRPTTPVQRWALALVALAVVIVFPTWADRASADYDDPLRDLDLQEIEIRHDLRELNARRMELRSARSRERAEAQLVELRDRIGDLESEGRLDEAEGLEHKLGSLEQRRQIEERAMAERLRRYRESIAMRRDLERDMLELRSRGGEVDPERLEQIERALADHRRDLELLEVEARELEELGGSVHHDAFLRDNALAKRQRELELALARAAEREANEPSVRATVREKLALELEQLALRRAELEMIAAERGQRDAVQGKIDALDAKRAELLRYIEDESYRVLADEDAARDDELRRLRELELMEEKLAEERRLQEVH